MMRRAQLAALLAVAALAALATACGYHLAGNTNLLPADVHTIAVLPFENRSRTPQVSQAITAAVAQELVLRAHYRIQPTAAGADAVLHGTLLSMAVTPVAFDEVSGRATTVEVVLHVQAWLTHEPDGKQLYRADNLVFHDQYQITASQQDFFEENSAAQARLSQMVAQTLVADILEAF